MLKRVLSYIKGVKGIERELIHGGFDAIPQEELEQISNDSTNYSSIMIKTLITTPNINRK